MMYEVNEKGKKIKQIIIYVIILLSVLCCSIFAGVKVAQLYKVGETKNKRPWRFKNTPVVRCVIRSLRTVTSRRLRPGFQLLS